MGNALYFGDCLDVMRESIPDESVDLIYLDPPFNSKRIYNASMGGAQWVAFDDTWRWSEAVDDFHEVAGDVELAPTMEGLRKILGEGSKLAYLSYMANRLRECHRALKPTGSIYSHCDPTMNYLLRVVMDAAFGAKYFRNEIVWSYQRWTGATKHFQRMHDTLLMFFCSSDATFNQLLEPHSPKGLHRHKGQNRITAVQPDGKLTQTYVKKSGTKAMRDVWEISYLNANAKERCGYPTQKPVKLLQRIIQASTNPGDVVLDPFCGCGTAIEAAHGLNRRWIGIDICVKACQVIEERMRRGFDLEWSEIEFLGMPKTPDHARTLAGIDPFHFERWAASLAPWVEANKRQRGDGGIDGRGRIPLRKGKFADVVCQVKSGGTNPGHVQAFNGARQQAGADMGIFTCFEDRVSSKMRDAAASTGRFYDVPVIQIYTVEDFFAGRVPKLPRAA